MKINNFTVIESEYGKFIVNRHCDYQAESLIKTGKPHIQGELNNILLLINNLPDHAIIVDGGANIGLVSIPIAQEVLHRGGTVHAFEVQRMLFNALCGSAALNDLENLIVHNQALGASPGILGLSRPDYCKPQDFGAFSLVGQGGAQTETVDVITIDSLDLPRLDFLKIDVEGMEIEVLKGARGSIGRYRPWCWIEYWKVDVEEIKAQLADFDYEFYIMDGLNMLCSPAGKLAGLGIVVNQHS